MRTSQILLGRRENKACHVKQTKKKYVEENLLVNMAFFFKVGVLFKEPFGHPLRIFKKEIGKILHSRMYSLSKKTCLWYKQSLCLFLRESNIFS